MIPSNVQIGKNTAISGVTAAEDYEDGVLASGETLIKQVREYESSRTYFGRSKQQEDATS